MSYYVNDNVSREFTVLYQTPLREKTILDEIILFVYETPSINSKVNGLENTSETTLCKIRTAPRKFDKYSLLDTQYARIYYWSNISGPHVFKPFWKPEKGVLKMDKQDIIDKARELADAGFGYRKQEVEQVIDEINKMNCHFEFFKDGYWNDEDRYSGDWATGELSVHFMKDQIALGSYLPVKLSVEAHMVVEAAWNEMKCMSEGISYNSKQFVKLLEKFDTYETKFHMYVANDNEEINCKSIYMMDNKIKNYEKDIWDEDVLSFINNVNMTKQAGK